MIYTVIIGMLFVFEIPQLLCRGIRLLSHILDEPTSLHPNTCRACGKDGVSRSAHSNKYGKDGKLIWTKYSCVYCGVKHKVMK